MKVDFFYLHTWLIDLFPWVLNITILSPIILIILSHWLPSYSVSIGKINSILIPEEVCVHVCVCFFFLIFVWKHYGTLLFGKFNKEHFVFFVLVTKRQSLSCPQIGKHSYLIFLMISPPPYLHWCPLRFFLEKITRLVTSILEAE